MQKLIDVLKSRKFWASLVGLAIVFFGSRAGIDPENLLNAVVIVVGYILGTAVEGLKK